MPTWSHASSGEKRLRVVGRGGSRARQQGVVLAVALIFLLLLTLIGVASVRDTTLQERMAGNLRDRNLAFQAAEAALRVGESWLVLNAATSNPTVRIDEPGAWNGASSPSPTGSVTLSDGVVASPTFHVGLARRVEPLAAPCDGTDPNCGWCIYPITSHGVGGTTDAVVIVQGQYRMTGIECR